MYYEDVFFSIVLKTKKEVKCKCIFFRRGELHFSLLELKESLLLI